MNVSKTDIDGLIIIEPKAFMDERGFFMETYNRDKYKELGINEDFLQDNISVSKKGTLRGLHYQKNPSAQGKLVQVLRGKVLDVAVDVRFGSPTFGKHFKIELSGNNKKQFFVPAGFAHGFLALEDDTLFSYKCTNLYSPLNERSIRWNDSDLNIEWPKMEYLIAEKDKNSPFFKEMEKDFLI